MYVKVFSQILESSIAEDYEQRHLFMDLLVLADREGVVDMTHEAISRRLNVPIEFVCENIDKLAEPDPMSRNSSDDGRRITLLDDHRNWGWQIVNYGFYRDMKDMESLRAIWREDKRKSRAAKCPQLSSDVSDSPKVSNGVSKSPLSESYSYSVSDAEEKSSCSVEDNGASRTSVLESETEEEARCARVDTPKKEKKRQKTPLMSEEAVETLRANPAYEGIDIDQETWKFKAWCETNGKLQSVRRFTNWLNRVV